MSAFGEWFADAPLPAGVPEPVDDIPFRWAQHGWDAAHDTFDGRMREVLMQILDAAGYITKDEGLNGEQLIAISNVYIAKLEHRYDGPERRVEQEWNAYGWKDRRGR